MVRKRWQPQLNWFAAPCCFPLLDELYIPVQDLGAEVSSMNSSQIIDSFPA
jgi:hypothetical protein